MVRSKGNRQLKGNFQPTVLVLNQWAGPITWELSESLGGILGTVALLTGHTDTLNQNDSPHVKLFAAPAHNRSNYARRVVSWVRYLWRAFFWVWRFPRTSPLILYSNPPFLPWLGLLFKILRRQDYILIIHDIYPDTLVQLKKMSSTHLVVRLWRYVNCMAYARAALISTLGEQMAKNIAAQLPASKTVEIDVTPPWVDTEFIRPIARQDNGFHKEYGLQDKMVVLYSGNMGFGHDIETMLEAARRLQTQPEIHFVFIGAGPKWQLVQQVLEEEHLPNLTLLSWLPLERLPYSLSAGDLSLVSIEDGVEGLVLPSKAIYGMAAGSVAVVLARETSELAHWINEFECGKILRPGDVDGLVEIIKHFAEHADILRTYKDNARHAAETLFGKTQNTNRLIALICDKVLDRSSP
jgi:glycosyltransferase involved in cell wall biosynthesis